MLKSVRALCACLMAVQTSMLVACSIPDRIVTEAGSGETGGGSGGTGGGSGETSPECDTDGELRCSGNTRERCDGEHWVELPAKEQCGGATSACTGAGVCATYRLASSKVDAFGVATIPDDAAYVVRDQSLLENPRACGADFCVSGGIEP